MGLPSGYIRAEYVQSTGMQYFSTGFNANNNTRVVVDVDIINADGWSPVFGARTAVKNNDYGMFFNNTTGQIQDDYATTQAMVSFSGIIGRHVIDKNMNITSIDGVQVNSFTASNFSTSYDIYLFDFNTGGSSILSSYQISMKLYSCQIYDTGTLVRDFVPCVNPDGAAGLYDLVNNGFYKPYGTESIIACINQPIIGNIYIDSYKKILPSYANIDGVWKNIIKSYTCIQEESTIYWKESCKVYSVSSAAETPPSTGSLSYSVDSVSGASYGFTLTSDGYYTSQNAGVANSAALCRITFVNTTGSAKTVTLNCINYAESNYDFGIIGSFNTALRPTYLVDSSYTKSFKGSSTSSVQTVSLTVPTGTNWIDVKYRKDSSANNNNDSLKFQVVI